MHMIKFQHSARAVRGFYEADTDVEIMQKLIENLMDDMDIIKENQTILQSNLDKISLFIQNRGITSNRDNQNN